MEDTKTIGGQVIIKVSWFSRSYNVTSILCKSLRTIITKLTLILIASSCITHVR